MATRTATSRTRRSDGQLRRWLLIALPLLVIVGLVVATSLNGEPEPSGRQSAPDFTLTGTDGASFQLADALGEGDTLLYFSMGVGCDGCFAQLPEITDELDARGITLASVMVDPASTVAAEAARFGVEDPILIDADRSVSEAYGMIGIYGHPDRPSHSFALVSPEGTVEQVEHYATMFVPVDQLLDDFGIA